MYSFLIFDSVDRILVLFVFDPVCTFGKFINFGIGTIRSERVIYFQFISKAPQITTQLIVFAKFQYSIAFCVVFLSGKELWPLFIVCTFTWSRLFGRQLAPFHNLYNFQI